MSFGVLRFLQCFRLARRDGHVAADGEIVRRGCDAKPGGLAAIGIEDLLDAPNGLEAEQIWIGVPRT